MSRGVLIMSTFEAGTTAVAAPRRGTEYAVLLRRVRDAGLLDRRVGFYVWRLVVTVALLAGGWLVFGLVGDSWWQVVVAVFAAVTFAQVGFLAHDAGHKQMFHSRRVNDVVGLLLSSLAVGLGYSWWLDNHNRHHAHPNTDVRDPDVNFGALAFTAGQAGGRGRLARVVYRYQAYFFFPLLLFSAVGLHVDSGLFLARRGGRGRVVERVLFAAHVVGYLGVVFWVLSPVRAVVFVVVHQGLLGLYLGMAFAPNHKGMPMLGAEDRSGFLDRQVVTSRNIRGGWLTDIVLGGLNYQIEHHLFPSMPRPNLRRAQRLVRQFCAEIGLPYTETSLVDSYAQTLRYLNQVGQHPRLGAA
jgi:fatty acid desaturase